MRKHRKIRLIKDEVIEVPRTTDTGMPRNLCPRCARLIGRGEQKNTLMCKSCGLKLGKITGRRYRILDWDDYERE